MLTSTQFGEVAVAFHGIGIPGPQYLQHPGSFFRKDAHLRRGIQHLDGIDITYVVEHIPGAVAAIMADIEGLITRRCGSEGLLCWTRIGEICAAGAV